MYWIIGLVVCVLVVLEVIDEVIRYKRREEKRDNWRLYYSYGKIMEGFYRSGDVEREKKYVGYRRDVLRKICKDWWEYDVIEGERKSSMYVRYI